MCLMYTLVQSVSVSINQSLHRKPRPGSQSLWQTRWKVVQLPVWRDILPRHSRHSSSFVHIRVTFTVGTDTRAGA
jgi:hypothetical protein